MPNQQEYQDWEARQMQELGGMGTVELAEHYRQKYLDARSRTPSFQRVSVLDHGFVQLLDVMGSDRSIEQAARLSYDKFDEGRTPEDTQKLLRILLRHRHTSPFEMGEVKFRVKCPIFVQRQWIRHRTANVNEVSARYTELPDEFWEFDAARRQDPNNKQGSVLGEISKMRTQFGYMHEGDESGVTAEEAAFIEYRSRLDDGAARETARSCLPVSTYTEYVWKNDLHNTMHFLKLRLDPHAQLEIRLFAEAMYEILQPLFPVTFEAFDDYVLNSVSFSAQECELLRGLLLGHGETRLPAKFTDRELREYRQKISRIMEGPRA